jgi:hypothetical protein
MLTLSPAGASGSAGAVITASDALGAGNDDTVDSSRLFMRYDAEGSLVCDADGGLIGWV